MQQPLFPPESDWRPPSMADLPSWEGAADVGIDTETYDPNLKTTGPSVRTGGHVAGVSFSIRGGPKHYLPIRHEGGDNLDADQVLAYLRHQAGHFTGNIVGAHLMYDLDWLAEEGIWFEAARRFKDIQIAEPLLDEHKWSYSLNNLASEWVGDQKDDGMMAQAAREYGMGKREHVGAWIHKLAARYVGPYATQDADLVLRILDLQEAEIERQKLEHVWDLESRVLPVTVKMRRRGVRVNLERLAEVENRCTRERYEAAEFISRETGVSIGPDDAMKKGELVKALRAAGHNIEPEDALDKQFIAGHESCPVVAALGRLRKWDTLRKLSIEPVKMHQIDGRIHATFNQLRRNKDDDKGLKGAAYGRFSCENPNLQQQPSRDEDIAPIWRRIYEPEQEREWAANDYSQQEPRIVVHFAALLGLNGAAEFAERYRSDPSTDYHQLVSELINVPRKLAKIPGLAKIYGKGDKNLCRELGLPTKIITTRKGRRIEVAGPEGQAILDRFAVKVPFCQELADVAEARAKQNGFVRTLSGRKCRFPRTDDGLNYDWTHKALNRIIQGSAADQTKEALVAVDAAGHFVQLQIHDEIASSVENREEASRIARLMEDVVQLEVPSKVDVEVGPSWGEAE